MEFEKRAIMCGFRRSGHISTSIKSFFFFQEKDFQSLQTQLIYTFWNVCCVCTTVLFMVRGINIILYVDALWRHSYPTGLSQRKHSSSLWSIEPWLKMYAQLTDGYFFSSANYFLQLFYIYRVALFDWI